MKKVVAIIGGLAAIVVAVLLGMPIVTSTVWHADTANDLTEMYATTSPNIEASTEFIGLAKPTDKQYDEEIARNQANVDAIDKTINAVDDLGPNTIDVTGQYEKAAALEADIIEVLKDLKANSEDEIEILTDEKDSGRTVKSTEDFSKAADAISANYSKLEKLVGQL